MIEVVTVKSYISQMTKRRTYHRMCFFENSKSWITLFHTFSTLNYVM